MLQVLVMVLLLEAMHFCKYSGTVVSCGQPVSSSLSFAAMAISLRSGNIGAEISATSGSPSTGTWRCLGYANGGTNHGATAITLFQRIA